ncbi:hypothetical protein T484DRAFT_1796994 [Baffinella frigidus]|nr:hypothetical protein T484DRAFT_1796994 [Cryptophyta sp. CCMP2293]
MSSLGMSSVRALLRPMARTTAQRASFWTSTPPVEPTPPAEAGMEIPWEQGRSTYRKLLRACRNYPSIKRDGIYADIRLDFKDHASITDPKKILRFRSQALSGLEGDGVAAAGDMHG